MGEVAQEAARRHDAAAGRAAARRGDARRARVVAYDHARSRGGRRSRIPGRPRAPSSEPRRIRERRARSARARRRSVDAAAARRLRRTGSTTSATCSGCRRCCSSGSWRPPAKSARSRSAIPTSAPPRETFHIRQDASQDIHVEGHADRHGRRHPRRRSRCRSTPSIRSRSRCSARTSASMRGLEYEHEIEYTVDGARVHTFRMGGEADFKANLVNMTKAGDVDRRARPRSRCKLTAGPHVIGAAFVARSDAHQPDAAAAVHPQLHRHARHVRPSALRHADGDRAVQRDGLRRHAEPPQDLQLPSRSRRPSEDACARQIIATARAPRVSRRRQRRRRAAAVRVLRRRPRKADAAAFERGIQKALQRILASPKFCFHIEQDPAGARARLGLPHQRSSSSPRACRSSSGAAFPTRSCSISPRRTSCTRRRCSRQQVRRMLADPKADALDDELRRPVAVSAQPEEHAAELGGVPRLRRQPAAGVRTGSGAVLRRASSTKTAACST